MLIRLHIGHIGSYCQTASMSFAPFALMNKLGCLSLAENCQLQACSVAWHPSSRSFVSVDFRKRVLHLSFQIKRGQKAKAIKGFLWGISSRIAPSSQKENTWSQGMPLEAIYIGLSPMTAGLNREWLIATSCPQPQNNCSPSPKPPYQRMSLHFQAYHSQMLFAEGTMET